MTDQELVEQAFAMHQFSYAPYSKFPVGAALLCEDGTVFTGCNVENAAFGSAICAERTAVAKAVSEGHTDFVRIAVAGGGDNFCVPCGVCRQVLQEFAPDLEVICLNEQGQELTLSLRELLPHGFDRSFLPQEP